jgi:hypothetical protein
VIHGDTRRPGVGDLRKRCRKIDEIYSEIRRDTGRSAIGGPVEI